MGVWVVIWIYSCMFSFAKETCTEILVCTINGSITFQKQGSIPSTMQGIPQSCWSFWETRMREEQKPELLIHNVSTIYIRKILVLFFVYMLFPDGWWLAMNWPFPLFILKFGGVSLIQNDRNFSESNISETEAVCSCESYYSSVTDQF